jgi:hypothetical protein
LQIWDFEFIGYSSTRSKAVRLAIGSASSDVTVWEAWEPSEDVKPVVTPSTTTPSEVEESVDTDGVRFQCEKIGYILRGTKGRTTCIRYLPGSRCLLIAGQDRCVEVFHVRSEAESKKKLQKRVKAAAKAREKAENPDDCGDPAAVTLALSDQIARRTEATVDAGGRVKSFDAIDVSVKGREHPSVQVSFLQDERNIKFNRK